MTFQQPPTWAWAFQALSFLNKNLDPEVRIGAVDCNPNRSGLAEDVRMQCPAGKPRHPGREDGPVQPQQRPFPPQPVRADSPVNPVTDSLTSPLPPTPSGCQWEKRIRTVTPLAGSEPQPHPHSLHSHRSNFLPPTHTRVWVLRNFLLQWISRPGL